MPLQILVFALIAAALCDQPSERVKKQVVVASGKLALHLKHTCTTVEYKFR